MWFLDTDYVARSVQRMWNVEEFGVVPVEFCVLMESDCSRLALRGEVMPKKPLA